MSYIKFEVCFAIKQGHNSNVCAINHQWLPWHTVASHTPTTNGCHDTLWQASHQPPLAAMTHCGKPHTNHQWLPWHTVASLTPTTNGCHDTLWQASHQPPMAAMTHCGKPHTNHQWLPWHTVASHTVTLPPPGKWCRFCREPTRDLACQWRGMCCTWYAWPARVNYLYTYTW